MPHATLTVEMVAGMSKRETLLEAKEIAQRLQLSIFYRHNDTLVRVLANGKLNYALSEDNRKDEDFYTLEQELCQSR